jgi:hypothetical protein
MSTRTELSSVATGLDELAERVSSIAEGLLAQEREIVGPQLFEIERALRRAQRGLQQILDR